MFGATIIMVAWACRSAHYTLEEPVESQIIEVKADDRWNVWLNENATTGFRWEAECKSVLLCAMEFAALRARREFIFEFYRGLGIPPKFISDIGDHGRAKSHAKCG